MPISSLTLSVARSTNQIMLYVCLALIPGIAVQFYFFSWGVLINLALCSMFAIALEALIMLVRKRQVSNQIKNHSALVSGMLIGVSVPPIIPVWMLFIAVSFAIIFAKQLYGGLGYNIFNPAMVGYAVLLVSFPLEMTQWLPAKSLAINTPSFTEFLQLGFFGKTSAGLTIHDFRLLADGFSMATPLDLIKSEYAMGKMTDEIYQLNHFAENKTAWLYINLGFLSGGLFLLAKKIIRWHIPVALLLGVYLTSSLLHWHDEDLFASGWFHLSCGATMLGAFFIATDPVTASTTIKGRLIYAALIGFLVVIIRTFGGYPDAMAFAILILNIAVPTIDYYTARSKTSETQRSDN